MFEIYQFSEPKILAFILILLRMTAFVVSWPVFVSNVPNHAKILFALVVSIVIFPVVSWQGVQSEIITNKIVWLAAREVVIGLFLGYLARLFFFAVNGAGELISFSMGFSSAQLFNPMMDSQSSIMEQFQTVIATIFFLAINGHHLLLAGLVQSYEMVPLSMTGINLGVFRDVVLFGQQIIELSIKISAPVLVAILLMNIAMGIIGRAVPQINVLVTSLSVNILVGFFVLIVSMPIFLGEMSGFVNDMTLKFFEVMKAL